MIKDKNDAIDKQIYQNNKKSQRKMLIGLMSSVAFASYGIVTAFFAPIVGIPALLTSLGLGLTTRNINKKGKQVNTRLLKEKVHLKRVEEKGLDTSKDISNKRINKVIELKDEKTKKEKIKRNLNVINVLATAGLVASTIAATVIGPTIGLTGGIISAIVKLSAETLISKKNDEIETLKNRINNINNDLDIIRNRVKTVPFRNSDIKIKSKKIEEQPKTVEKERGATKKNEDVVEQYIASLSQENAEEKPSQKVKQ